MAAYSRRAVLGPHRWRLDRPELDRSETEHDNLRAALGWSAESGEVEAGLRLGAALQEFWSWRGYIAEGRERLRELLALPGASGATAVRAHALYKAGWLASDHNDREGARPLFEESLAIYRKLDDKAGIAKSLYALGGKIYLASDQRTARVPLEESLALFRELGDKGGVAASLRFLGYLAWFQGDHEAGRDLMEESLAIYRELNARMLIPWGLQDLGWVAQQQSDNEAAQKLYEESLAMLRELGYDWAIGQVLCSLGNIAHSQGNYGAARALYEESLVTSREHRFEGEDSYWLNCLGGLAQMAAAQGQPERAALLFGTAEGLREGMGVPLLPAERAEHDRSVAAVRAALGEEAFAGAWAEGRAMGLEEAVRFALEEASVA